MRISPVLSAEAAISRLEKLLAERISQYRSHVPYREHEVKKSVQSIISAIEKYIRQGNTAYLGYAKVYSDLPESDDGVRSYATFEIYWSRIDLKDFIICVGVMGRNDYKQIASDPRYRFFFKVKMSKLIFQDLPSPTVIEVEGLSLDNDILWKVIREIEYSYFARYPATKTIFEEQRFGIRRSSYQGTKFYVKFNKTLLNLIKFRENIINLFGEKSYTDQQIWHLFSTVEILKVNKNIPAILSSSKRSYFYYLITQKRVFSIADLESKGMKNFLSSFKNWSNVFFFKKILPALVVSGKLSVVDDPNKII